MLHRLLAAAAALVVIVAVGMAVAAWRLSQGPWESPWLARRLEQAANQDGRATVRIATAALAWEGFSRGVDLPLDIRVTGLTATSPAGAALLDIPRGEVSLSVGALLLGRLRPRAIELHSPRVTLARAADGALSLDLGGAPATGNTTAPSVAGELGRPAKRDRDQAQTRLGQLRRVLVQDAVVTVEDHQLGLAWSVERGDIDLHRRPQGGVDGQASATVAFGGQNVPLTATASLQPGGTSTAIHLTAGPITPASLAGAAPGLERLAALDAAVSVDATAELGPDLRPRELHAEAAIGAGRLALHGPPILLAHARVAIQGTPERIELTGAEAVIRAREDGLASTLRLHGTIHRAPDLIAADLALDLDQASFADLSVLWPELTPGGARPWLTENIVAGTARHGHFDVSLSTPADLSDPQLTAASGTMDADGLTVHWLRPVPPIDQGRVQLRVLDPDTMEIVVQGGHQQMPGGDKGAGLALRGGRMRIRGIVHKDQFGVIDADIAGSVADTLALLRVPRLKLLDKHPLDIREPGGRAAIKLAVTLPLENKVTMEQIGIQTTAHLDDVHLGGVVAGRDLDQGTLEIDANQDGLKSHGRALLAGIESQLALEMDFRAGPPSQVVQSVVVTGMPDVARLSASGLAIPAVTSGTALLHATLTERRDGAGALHLDADLKDAALTAAPFDWSKPPGAPAAGVLDLRLDHDKLAGVDRLSIEGDDISVHGVAEYADGQPSLLRLDRLTLGRTQARGTVRFPGHDAAAPILIVVNGAMIDLSGRFSHHDAHAARSAAAPASPRPRGQAWTASAQFDQALMGQGQVVSGAALRAEYDGRVFERLRLDGRVGNAALHLAIEPKGGQQRGLIASAADAGALLRAVDIDDKMQGGRLSVTGTFDDATPEHKLTGSATVLDFRIRDAPAMARLLQAMTLYGLVEVAQGPGLGFIKAIVPFSLTGDTLELFDARAYSASLGMTAKGRIDIAGGTADIAGTIVPAYMLNAALGNIPLVGRLFTSERGGGLFAATYTIGGTTTDPKVSVNPLSVLAPGFLRGLFGG